MDKIDLTQWDQYFGTTEQQLVHSSERYTHFTVQFQQPGLAAGKLYAINTPGMLFTELFMEAVKQNAPSIILSHCHPSGNGTIPSPEDIRVTELAIEAARSWVEVTSSKVCTE